MKLQKTRQAFKSTLLFLIFAGICLSISVQAQSDKTKIDYSKRSNILNPDTLRGDQKKIFWHPYFLNLPSKEAIDLDSFRIKEEFSQLGIKTEEKERFLDAYSFYLSDIVSHKKSCEQWESFKDLAPKSE